MKPSGRKYQSCLIWIIGVIVVTPACNRLRAAGGAQTQQATAPAHTNVPFHSEPNAEPSAAESVRPGLPSEPRDSSLPFRSHARLLPAGTLLTVRLDRALNGGEVHAGDLFSAVLAEPVMIDGDTLVGVGTAVTGAVESTFASSEQGHEGYVRLVLSAITIDGKQLPLQTSSLFAQGAAQVSAVSSGRDTASPRLPPGRRLTFRLTAPAPLDEQSAIAYRPYSATDTD